LIARRVRELGVYCEIKPWDVGDAAVRAFGARGIILSGGPESVLAAGAPTAPAAVFEQGVPVLGICYGMQTIDVKTAHWAHPPYELPDVCSRRIVNEVPGISRAVYDIYGKAPTSVE
jgi:hypothetical protein